MGTQSLRLEFYCYVISAASLGNIDAHVFNNYPTFEHKARRSHHFGFYNSYILVYVLVVACQAQFTHHWNATIIISLTHDLMQYTKSFAMTDIVDKNHNLDDSDSP